MCLSAKKPMTSRLLNRFKKKNGKLTFYKLVRITETGSIVSPFMNSFRWNAGQNSCGVPLKLHIFKYSNYIHSGFHVATNIVDVKLSVKNFNKFGYRANHGETITYIKVVGYKKHFVAAGKWEYNGMSYNSAVFSKLFVPKSEIDRIKKLLKGK